MRNRTSFFKLALGRLWSVAEPMAHMAIYYFVVVIVFGARAIEGVSPFVIIMLGIVHFTFVARALTTSVSAIFSSEVVLLRAPVEPLVFTAVAFLEALHALLWPLVIYFVIYALVPPQTLTQPWYYPLFFATLIVFCWSYAVLFSTLGVFLRDLKNFVSIGLRIVMYASPVVYASTLVPEPYREVLLYNPLAALFALMQWSLLGVEPPQTSHVVSLVAFTVVSFALAHLIYRGLKRQFTKAF